jgi:hypothetical protein
MTSANEDESHREGQDGVHLLTFTSEILVDGGGDGVGLHLSEYVARLEFAPPRRGFPTSHMANPLEFRRAWIGKAAAVPPPVHQR